MDRILKVGGGIVAAVLGLLVWIVFPEAQTIIACLPAATLICFVFHAAVKATVERLIGDELVELRLHINDVAERLELIDRKTTAILRHALEQRQAAKLRDAAPMRGYPIQRRSA
jgi:hypothetical protein